MTIPAFFFGCRYPMITRPCARLQSRRRTSLFFSVRYDHHFRLRNYKPYKPPPLAMRDGDNDAP